MLKANMNVIKLAIIIGLSTTTIPYKSQRNTPTVNIPYIAKDMLLVSFSFITFIDCGKNEAVVNVAAINPIYSNVIPSLLLKFI